MWWGNFGGEHFAEYFASYHQATKIEGHESPVVILFHISGRILYFIISSLWKTKVAENCPYHFIFEWSRNKIRYLSVCTRYVTLTVRNVLMFSSYIREKRAVIYYGRYISVWSDENLPDKCVNTQNGSWYKGSVTDWSGCAESQFPVHCFLEVNRKITFNPCISNQRYNVTKIKAQIWSFVKK
jgi:hypothetical protein